MLVSCVAFFVSLWRTPLFSHHDLDVWCSTQRVHGIQNVPQNNVVMCMMWFTSCHGELKYEGCECIELDVVSSQCWRTSSKRWYDDVVDMVAA